jgi:monofunctional glycosyltransferase
MRRKLWRWLGRVLVLGIGLLLVYELWIFGHVLWWNWFNPSTSAFMEQRLEQLQEKGHEARLHHQWIAYDKISLNLKRALIAAEDANFMEHEGFDWDAIQKAYEKNLKKGKIVAGGSTISQQLAKNLFLSGRRSPLRKVQEAIITVMIETVMSKQRIFEIYLNSIEWGTAVFGAEAAARYYYNHGAANLDAWEAARLAAMVPKPRYYDHNRETPWLDAKTNLILERMPSAQVP